MSALVSDARAARASVALRSARPAAMRSARHVAVAAAAAAALASLPLPLAAAETFDIGLAGNGTRIDALAVAGRDAAAPTVLLVGGLDGDDATAAAVRAAVTSYEQRRARDRAFNLLAVPVANPERARLEFPPSGVAYREHSESHALWRWIGTHGPDLVLVAGATANGAPTGGGAANGSAANGAAANGSAASPAEDFGLEAALGAQAVAGVGRVPSRRWTGPDELATLRAADVPASEAHRELERRGARSPRRLAEELAQHYGHDFDPPWYIGAIALIARIELGDVDDVRRIVEPYVDGTKDSLAQPSSLTMAGHIVFTELARRTHDPRYVAAVRKVGDLGFEPDGRMKEAMPYHNEFSDSIFMGTAIVAQAGALTGERKYFDMAARHLAFMQKLDRRADGLYRHQPATDAAWGRGNGFAALGLALTLAELPRDHPAYASTLASYRELMAALAPFQNRDGLWRNVIDYPGAYAELSATAMIGYALARGLHERWISGKAYERAVERAWGAVDARVASSGELVDVCESTARMTSLEQYLRRAAILGKDPRGGAMAMLFAMELASPSR
jgi:rhamnogalacturonyl hydrolase YesR